MYPADTPLAQPATLADMLEDIVGRWASGRCWAMSNKTEEAR
ncbi:hypothetical protein EDD30_6528 [Couchioplanes caeruleus]|uniref:Uncharacterized protein n=1 Tax=Couchioplanes caeruleus TaxID=56438 RepID=A0A3N1GTH7_9ACTN|nr:hypothetical protein EDD30_6528 [Couchioplanes caeruleus]